MTVTKGLLVILDGGGDRPSPALDGKTPLEAAATPVLDGWAKLASCGHVDPLYPGIPVGTQTGTGILMGLAPRDVAQLARGPVEAAGVGLTLRPGDVAVRCNFATLQEENGGFVVVDRRAGRIREGTLELAESLGELDLGDGVTAVLRPATQHRAVLRLSGPGLSPAITDTDPGDGSNGSRVLQCMAERGEPGATRTAEAVNRFIRESYQRLAEHPVNRGRASRGEAVANGIITRGAGTVRHLRSMIHHVALRTAVVAGESTVRGLAEVFNYTVITEPSFTSLPDTDLNAKVARAIGALEDHDLVYLHLKGGDIAAHDRNPLLKRAFLERVDRALGAIDVGSLVVGLSGDHCTDSNSGRHTGDPVPSLLLAPTGRRDRCETFDESSTVGGGLGRIPSTAFLCSMLDAMGALHNFRPSDLKYFAGI